MICLSYIKMVKKVLKVKKELLLALFCIF